MITRSYLALKIISAPPPPILFSKSNYMEEIGFEKLTVAQQITIFFLQETYSCH
jgi:hypothetical protein